jgi:hypothetical protein
VGPAGDAGLAGATTARAAGQVDRAQVQTLMKSCAGYEVTTLMGDVRALTAQLDASGIH